MSVLDTVIGLLAPTECVVCQSEGSPLCSACAAAEIVPYGERCFDCGAISRGGLTCGRCSPNAPTHVWVTTNYENAARQLVRVYKFGHQRAAAAPLADLMVKTALDFNTIEDFQKQAYKIVPIPTASSRVRQRSFDHSDLLARQIARKLGGKYVNALVRLGQSRQVGAARSIRLRQLEGQYLIRSAKLIKGQSILLIDDVVTTGSTLRAVTKAMRAAGARRVDALVFAKRL